MSLVQRISAQYLGTRSALTSLQKRAPCQVLPRTPDRLLKPRCKWMDGVVETWKRKEAKNSGKEQAGAFQVKVLSVANGSMDRITLALTLTLPQTGSCSIASNKQDGRGPDAFGVARVMSVLPEQAQPGHMYGLAWCSCAMGLID